MTDILEKTLKKKSVKINGKLVSGKEAFAMKLIEYALVKGEGWAMKYVYDRIDGKPNQTIKFNPADMPLIEVEYDLSEEAAAQSEPGEGGDDDN